MATHEVKVKKVSGGKMMRMFLSTLLLLGGILASGTAAQAAPATVGGAITIKPGSARIGASSGSLIVTAHYTGDDPLANNQLRIEWGLSGIDYSLGNQTIAHQASPYVFTINGLSNTNKYQVRVTFVDPDGAPAARVFTDLKPYDSLIHNAVTTVSSKWPDGWGTADANSQYGEFACDTCHTRNTTNAKRLKTTIVSPKAGQGQNFSGNAVLFLDAREGSSHFGNDSGGRATSNRICEICHTRTNYHRYNTAGQPSLTHYNQADCTSCHKHSNGFKAGCTDCHGNSGTGAMWPDDSPGSTYPDRAGAHAKHVQKIGNMLASGDKENSSQTTTAHKNATCVYCHPNPGGTNANGAGHAVNTTGSPENVADMQLDGFNTGAFKTISGTTDPDGRYNPTIKRCSNVDCHSNGDFTWTWYGDAIAPGAITDLAASSGNDVGTVRLTWTAPPNDGDTGPIAYQYQVRYSTSPITDAASWNAAAIAGGPPSVLRGGSTQTMVVRGLPPGTDPVNGTLYYFAVKTADEVWNWSALSNPVSARAGVDRTPPVFRGLVSAAGAGIDGAVNLSWSPAEDDTGPITYNIYWLSGAATVADIIADGVKATTTNTAYQVTGRTNGLPYRFVVRAKDGSPAGNEDTNEIVKEAMPTGPGVPASTSVPYKALKRAADACGTTYTNPANYLSTLADDATNWSCTGTSYGILSTTSTTNWLTWYFNNAYDATKTRVVSSNSFEIYVRERDGRAQTLQFELGKTDASGGNFQAFDVAVKKLTPDMRRTLRISFSGRSGTVSPSERLALRVKKNDYSGSEVQFRFSSERYPSLLWVNERWGNTPPTGHAFSPQPSGRGIVPITWTPATDPDGDTIHYDVYAALSDGTLPPATPTPDDNFDDGVLNTRWTKTDVGTTNPAGAPTESVGTLSMPGGGTSIGSTTDRFTYLHQGGIRKDFELTVKLNSLANTNSLARAGIMVRQSLAANSKHASVLITPSSGITFARRTSAGGTTTSTTRSSVVAPQYLKLVRSGVNFTASYSADGSTWTALGTASLLMDDPVYIGLAVTSGTSGARTTAVFDDFATTGIGGVVPEIPYPIVVALDVPPNGASPVTVNWNTVTSGIGLTSGQSVMVKVTAGDLYGSTSIATPSSWVVNNTGDTTPPAAVTDLKAEHRPKSGSVYLYWTAPGDDGGEGRAAQYDIRYKVADVNRDGDELDAKEGPITEALWGDNTVTATVTGEPVPGKAGAEQGYEVLGLEPGLKYYFALKSADEAGNWSPLSPSISNVGGPKCGVCHSTPPDDTATIGTHLGHGYTQTNCARCHGSESEDFLPEHMDGTIRLSWGALPLQQNGAGAPTVKTGTKIQYQQNGYTIYEDNSGGGGFDAVANADGTYSGDRRDNGSCMSFNNTGVTGCHGAGTPTWGNTASVNCAMCHGDPNRNPNLDPYGRPYDDPTADASPYDFFGTGRHYSGGKRIVLAAPAIDLKGQAAGVRVGQHLKHLNYSYRLTGDSCTLCHKGMNHTDGKVDVHIDNTAAGVNAVWDDASGVTNAAAGTCMGTSQVMCHGDYSGKVAGWKKPEWDSAFSVECNNCHGFVGKAFNPAANTSAIPHVKDGGQVRDCTYCHLEGHPKGAAGGSVLIPNYEKVGIYYTTGGIHLRNDIQIATRNGNVPYGSEAEICWGCHAANGVSEWGVNTTTAAVTKKISAITKASPAVVTSSAHGLITGDTITLAVSGMTQLNGWTGTVTWVSANTFSLNGVNSTTYGTFTSGTWTRAPYNYGTLNQTNWIGATWTSPNFKYKTGTIRSTHSANPEFGVAGVEDSPGKIRCSYCHDVHDLNKVPNDKSSGKPFLRGTWVGNLYREDGAPRWDTGGDQHTYTTTWLYGAVPRGNMGPGSGRPAAMGGYWIDQNSGTPTAGKSINDMAGICEMCHGNNDGRWDSTEIDVIDQFEGENNWFGDGTEAPANGHANSVLGGTGALAPQAGNILTNAKRGANYLISTATTWSKPLMGYEGIAVDTELYGTRNNNGDSLSSDAGTGVKPFAYNPGQSEVRFTYDSGKGGGFEWGVVQDNTAIDDKYHEFSCSKCHNPHASRLPRLMITNCLDVRNNTWDDQWRSDADWTSGYNSRNYATNNLQSTVYNNDGTVLSTITRPNSAGGGRDMAYLKSAQNCHRAVDANTGWNKITPPASPAGPWNTAIP